MNTDTSLARSYRQIAVGIVDGVLNIAVFQILLDFQSSHSGAVFFGFRSRSADMRQSDNIVDFQYFFGGEIGNIKSDSSFGNSLFNISIVYQLTAGEV